MSEKPKVYFSKTITPEKIVEMYKMLNINLPGKIAVKVHSGEINNKNFIKPELFKPIVDYVKGYPCETNTAYHRGERYTTELHKGLLEKHGWSKVFPNFDLLDADGDYKVEIPDGFKLKYNYLGNHMKNYDSILILSHFKGHFSGGFGGAMKQLSIGFGTAKGKSLQHSGGEYEEFGKVRATHEVFQECMADAAHSVMKMFKGKAAFINVMMNISVDCDCASEAKPPAIKDIGVLSSLDPVALDKACYDLVEKNEDEGKSVLLERMADRKALYGIEMFSKHGWGSLEYELVNVD